MKWILGVLCLLALLVAVVGCGNVYLQGDAMTACQTSAMDAYGASQRAHVDANAAGEGMTWEAIYLDENYKQWRSFVRSATKDTTWGPKLPGE